MTNSKVISTLMTKEHLKAYIALGSNVGDRSLHLEQAIEHLENALEIPVSERSHVYLSEAWGVTEQNDFYNQIIVFETDLSPEAMLKTCQDVEVAMGRDRMQKWHARNIDIDLLFLGELERSSSSLTLPHPMIEHRNFVLVPMMELAPQLMHPILGKNIEELYLQTEDMLEVLMLEMNG